MGNTRSWGGVKGEYRGEKTKNQREVWREGYAKKKRAKSGKTRKVELTAFVENTILVGKKMTRTKKSIGQCKTCRMVHLFREGR